MNENEWKESEIFFHLVGWSCRVSSNQNTQQQQQQKIHILSSFFSLILIFYINFPSKTFISLYILFSWRWFWCWEKWKIYIKKKKKNNNNIENHLKSLINYVIFRDGTAPNYVYVSLYFAEKYIINENERKNTRKKTQSVDKINPILHPPNIGIFRLQHTRAQDTHSEKCLWNILYVWWYIKSEAKDILWWFILPVAGLFSSSTYERSTQWSKNRKEKDKSRKFPLHQVFIFLFLFIYYIFSFLLLFSFMMIKKWWEKC